MEISNYFVPVILLLPLTALLGIFVVSLATRSVLRRRRSRTRRADRESPGKGVNQPAADPGRS